MATTSLFLEVLTTAYLNLSLSSKSISSSTCSLDSNLALISDPFLLFYGTINDYKITDSTTTAKIVYTVTSHWGNFSKTSGRTTTDNSQQRFFSGDKGMEFSALTVRDIQWGR